MCDRHTSITDPTADFVLADLLTATEDLIDFSINVFDTIRLQSYFNDRNRRVNLAMQLQDATDAQKTEFGMVEIPNKPCTVTTTLKYDLTLYLDRILQSCKRTKANLMLLRVSRTRAANTTLLLVASTNVRVEQLNKKVLLLIRLVKENGGEFQTKKKKKKKIKDSSKTKLDDDKKVQSKGKTTNKQPLSLMSKEDLSDYVEIALSFRMIITKYRQFIQHIRDATKSALSSTGQASIANSIVLIPIAANAINELNNILNRLIRIAFTIEAESKYLRQPPNIFIPNEKKELYRQGTKDDLPTNETGSYSQMLLAERNGSSRMARPRTLEGVLPQREPTPHQYSSGTSLQRNTFSLLKQNENRLNIRNQSAIVSTSNVVTSTSNVNSFKLTPDIIANIFEDFFVHTNNIFD